MCDSDLEPRLTLSFYESDKKQVRQPPENFLFARWGQKINFKVYGIPFWEKITWKEKERKKKERIMPSLVATTSALVHTT